METETQLRVILRPSRTNGDDDPGHVAIFWEGENGPQCRGFEFDLLDLPDAFQDASRWRDYLFDHSVPGRIVDDINMLDDYIRGLPSLL
jgi:hypothetical protein